jgi:Uma2 family endonuclease
MAIRDTARRKLTYDDYVLIPEDGLRHEILGGEHYVTPAPTPRHQGAAGALYRALGSFVYEHRLGQVFFAPLDVVFSDYDIAQPDLLFISNERAGILGEKNVQGAPDLVVEILSDSTRRTDETVKRGLYERFGVLEYWLIDPKRRTLLVFRRSGAGFGPPQTLSGEAVLATPLFPGFEMRAGGIFESL